MSVATWQSPASAQRAASTASGKSESDGSESVGRAAPSEDAAAAEIHFQRGRDALAAEDWDSACTSFAESLRLDPAAGTAMNLAVCEEKRGNLATAWETWQQSLRLLPPKDRRRGFATERVAALEKDLPYLTITPPSDTPEPLTVTRDGVELGEASLAVALPVDPGSHEIVVQTPRHEPRTFRVDIAKGGREEVKLELGPLRPEPVMSATSDAPHPLRPWAYVAGGVGLVGVAGAVATGLMLPAEKETVDRECDQGQCSQAGVDAGARGETLLTLNTVSWIVAGAGLATGAVLFVLDTGDDESPETAVRLETRGTQLFVTGGF